MTAITLEARRCAEAAVSSLDVVAMTDWLALVGDSADRRPGLPGLGAMSTPTVHAGHQHLERGTRDCHRRCHRLRTIDWPLRSRS
jgi:hypothetical protein